MENTNTVNPGTENLSEKNKKKKNRGVETLFRITSKNHIEFSSIADHKANILIHINALVLSITITLLVRHMDEYIHLLIPTVILLSVCLLTIIFATLSTRPKITEGKISKEDIKLGKGNLLFFGNFFKMPLNDYEWGVNQLLNDDKYLYDSMIRDIYHIGQVLAKKYFYLRIAYNIFMYGLIVSVLAFLTTLLLHTI